MLSLYAQVLYPEYIREFPALKCVGVNNVSRVGICCFLYYKELLICNIVVYYLIVFIVK